MQLLPPALSGSRAVDWATFQAAHAGRRDAALRGARSLLDGNATTALSWLETWRFARHTEWKQSVLHQLLERSVSPVPAARSAALWPSQRLPPPKHPDRAIVPYLHWERLEDRCGDAVADDAEHRVAWGLHALNLLGAETDRRRRRPWQATPSCHADRDAATRRTWLGWMSGSPWMIRGEWEALFWPAARTAFRVLLQHRGFPTDRQTRILDDLREALFFMMLGSKEQIPGWRGLAARVLETAANGPITSLCRPLGADQWARVSRCAVFRGHGRASAAVAFPQGGTALRQAALLTEAACEDADTLDSLLDLHVALRLIQRWSEGRSTELTSAWRVVVQNRSRARARMRSVLSTEDPERLVTAVVSVPALYEHTRSAMGRYCRDWAWQQLSFDFSFFEGRQVDPPCHVPEDAVVPYTPEEWSQLKTWVLLVVLKGRMKHLIRWVHQGKTGDRDATWGRLLSRDLPADLRRGVTRGAGLQRVRTALDDSLWHILASWSSVLTQLAELTSESSRLNRRFHEVIDPVWNSRIGQPKVRYRQYLTHSQQALDLLRDRNDT